MTHPKSAEEILNELNFTPEDIVHYRIFDYVKKAVVKKAMHTFAEVWLREFAERVEDKQDNLITQAGKYLATINSSSLDSLRDQIIKEMKGETK